MSDSTKFVCQALIALDGVGEERCNVRLATLSKSCCPIHETAYNKSYKEYKAASALADSLRIHARIRRSEVNRLPTKSIRLHLDGIGEFLQAIEQEMHLRREHGHRFFVEVDFGHKRRLVELERDLENGRILEQDLRDALLGDLDAGRPHTQLCGPGGKKKAESVRNHAATPTPQVRRRRRHAQQKNGKGKAASIVGPPRKLCEKGEEHRRASIEPMERGRIQEGQSPNYTWEGKWLSQLPFCDANLPDAEVQSSCREWEEWEVRDGDALYEEKHLEPLSLANAGSNPTQRWSQRPEEVPKSAYKGPSRIQDASEASYALLTGLLVTPRWLEDFPDYACAVRDHTYPTGASAEGTFAIPNEEKLQGTLLLDRGAEGLVSSQADSERVTWPPSIREDIRTDEVGTFTGTCPSGPKGGAPPSMCISDEAAFLQKTEVTQCFLDIYTKYSCSWDALGTPAWVTSLPNYVASPGGGVELVELRADTPSKAHCPSDYEDLVTPGWMAALPNYNTTHCDVELWMRPLGLLVAPNERELALLLGPAVNFGTISRSIQAGGRVEDSVGKAAKVDVKDLRQGIHDKACEAMFREPTKEQSSQENRVGSDVNQKHSTNSVGGPNAAVPPSDGASSANEQRRNESPPPGPRHGARETPRARDPHAKRENGWGREEILIAGALKAAVGLGMYLYRRRG